MQTSLSGKRLKLRNLLKNLTNPGESLKWRTIQGAAAIIVGDGYVNFLRLAGNLIMTRLLYPEAFGLMLIVNLFYTALGMLSDAGIHTAVIVKSKSRGSEFINTAWTLTIIRGALLTVAGLLLASPMATFYQQPQLMGLIAATSFTALIGGFTSPNLMIYDRDVKKVPVIVLEAITTTLALGATIIWLLLYPSIWALVGHTIFHSIIRTTLSFFFFKGQKLKIDLNAQITREILSFGKWIFISTALVFLSSQGDKAIASRWMTAEQLGIFSIALGLAKITEIISGSMNSKLLLPVYTELNREAKPNTPNNSLKLRLALFLICSPLVIVFSTTGSHIIDFMYDSRYQDAGWMLQVIALGAIFSPYNDTMTAVVISRGQTYALMWLQAYRSASLISIMFLGGYLAGFTGLIYAIAIAPAAYYPVVSIYLARTGVNNIKFDTMSIAIIIIFVLTWWSLTSWPTPPT